MPMGGGVLESCQLVYFPAGGQTALNLDVV